MKPIETPNDKAKVTTAIRAYLDAKNAEKEAKAEAKRRSEELLDILDGDKEMDWTSDDGREYRLVATYGKTSRTLNADLIEKVLGVKITDECYAKSREWNELRVTIVK